MDRKRFPLKIWLAATLVVFLVAVPSVSFSERTLKRIKNLSHASGKLGTYRALIIGIDDYQDPKIPDLKTAVKDARAMADILRNNYGFRVETLMNRKATKAAIYSALRNLARSSKEGDSVLIYYAGHGDLDKTYDDGWWIPVDAKGGYPVSYLDNGQVQKAMRSMKAKHVLLISDSCYSGTLFGQARAMPAEINDKYYLNLYNEKSRWGMTSGNKTPVSDSGTGGHSVFAYQLLKTLRRNEKPYISTQEIYTRIAPIVANNSEQQPLCRPIRNTGDQGGEFIFVASSGAVLDTPVKTPAKSGQASISVDSNVSGADVMIDGRSVGTTNLPEVSVAPGEHRIAVQKEGYDTYRKRVSVKTGRTLSLYVDLSRSAPQKGSLYVETDPPNATVRILNITPAFQQGIALAAGRYQVEVSKSGYETKSMWVNLDAGEDKRLDIRLKETATAASGGTTWTDPVTGMAFVWVPKGCFQMGSNSGDNGEKPVHEVCLDGFWIGKYEVTQGEWSAIMGSNPSYFSNCGDKCPVEQVSWNDAKTFISKLNGRSNGVTFGLPSEAQWEYAARSGGRSETYSGDENIGQVAWYSSNSGTKTHPVGTKSPNRLGIYDMTGNVWEWCEDIYSDSAYSQHSRKNPIYTGGGLGRVYRGGSWYGVARFCRAAFRSFNTPGGRG